MVCRLLTATASLLWYIGSSMQASVVVVHGLSCSMARGIFPDQGQTDIPCITGQILNHWTTMEVPNLGWNPVYFPMGRNFSVFCFLFPYTQKIWGKCENGGGPSMLLSLSFPQFSASYWFKSPLLLLSLNAFLEEALISRHCVCVHASICDSVHVCVYGLILKTYSC